MKSRFFSLRAGVALLCALPCLLMMFAFPAHAAEPFVEKIDLFKEGDLGYKRYHIPGVLVTAKGTVLAWCEAREDGGDWDQIDVLLRRSTDDGRTWSEPKKISNVPGPIEKNPFSLAMKNVDPTDVTYNNPVLIADRDGTVHMVFCVEYMRCFYQRSEDDGVTWSEPVEITSAFEAFKKDYDWKVLATGPDHSIQLANGRLVVPVWLSTGTGGNAHRPSVTSTIYSDDDGKTWHAGEVAVPCTEEFINPNETVAVELKDGSVLLNVRNESKAHRRIQVTSPNGATDWSEPRFVEELAEPICMGGIVRYDHGGENVLLFCHPDNLSRADGKEEAGKNRDRRNVSVHISTDEGQTWSPGHSVEPSWSAYSDIGVTPEGTILCFYGRGEKSSFSGDRLTMARFNLEWLKARPENPRPAEFDKAKSAEKAETASAAAGIVLDDEDGEYVGYWEPSTNLPSYLGHGYRHAGNSGDGSKSVRFTPAIGEPGEYEVRLLYTASENRARKTQVSVASADGTKVLSIDQREPVLVKGVPTALGRFRFEKGEKGYVEVSNKGADGYVVVDGVQFILTSLADEERAGKRSAGFVATKFEPVQDEREKLAAAVAFSPLTPEKPGLKSPKPDTEPVALAKDAPAAEVNGKSYDLVVVGGTAGGIATAVRAARDGCTVLLVQHDRHIGGMLTNGLMQWDALYGGPRAPLFSELLTNIEQFYIDTYGRDSKTHQIVRYTHEKYPISWVEPHVMERECNRLVAREKNLTLLLDHFPVALEREGNLLKNVTLRRYGTEGEDITVSGAMFADGTYEGDLLALADVPYRVGREARDEYGEPHAGKVFVNIASGPPQSVIDEGLNIRVYGAHQGEVDPTSPFTADKASQAYNYRFCVSKDPKNRVMLTSPPPGYDREEYVNYERKGIATNAGPNQKSHMNSPILPGENHEYPEASWPEREKIIERHKNFALGLIWFLQNDESVSEAKKKGFREWGLAADEFQDHGNIPYEMYVREARRLVGRHILTELDGMLSPDYGRAPIQPDSVGTTDWYMDSHSCTTDSRPDYHYDGKLILTNESRPMQIPYRSLLPQGVDNLLVPVGLSSTHIAWGALRLEPVWMQTGEAAGVAAGLAKAKGTTPGELDSDLLIRTLAERRHLISFFNQGRVNDDDPRIPAAQYFGTKGFFASYDARLDEPLSPEVKKLWEQASADLKAGKLDVRSLAAKVALAEKTQSPEKTAAGGKSRGDFLLALWNEAPL